MTPASCRLLALTLAAIVSVLGGCAARIAGQPPPLPTLDGKPPLVIAHRGASGYLPEETLEAYARAIDLGADVIEMDLVSTSDGVLITRHDANLAVSTDIASRPEFAARQRTVQIGGQTQTGWFSADFTLAEIQTLGAMSTDRERPQQFNGLYRVPTFQQVLDLAKSRLAVTGRRVAIYPETKDPAWFRELGLPLEEKLLAILTTEGFNRHDAPVWVQSFDAASLKMLNSLGLQTHRVQLLGGSATVTPATLAAIKVYADGIGPAKTLVLSAEGNSSALVRDAHAAGLFVHPYTFRNEARYLPPRYAKNPTAEYLAYFRAGVDGVFTDFTDTAVAARVQYLKDSRNLLPPGIRYQPTQQPGLTHSMHTSPSPKSS